MDREQRIASLIDILQKEPNDVFLNYALGIEYIQLGKTQEALAQFHKVHHLDEQYIPAYYQEGKLLADAGNKEKALQQLKLGAEKCREQGDRKSLSEFEEAIFLIED